MTVQLSYFGRDLPTQTLPLVQVSHSEAKKTPIWVMLYLFLFLDIYSALLESSRILALKICNLQ